MGSFLTSMFTMYFVTGASDLVDILFNTKAYLVKLGQPAMLSIGAALMIYGGWKVLRAITGRTGQAGPQWGKAFLSIVFGGGFFFLGWQLNNQVGSDAQQTVTNLTGMVAPLLGTVDLHSFLMMLL